MRRRAGGGVAGGSVDRVGMGGKRRMGRAMMCLDDVLRVCVACLCCARMCAVPILIGEAGEREATERGDGSFGGAYFCAASILDRVYENETRTTYHYFTYICGPPRARPRTPSTLGSTQTTSSLHQECSRRRASAMRPPPCCSASPRCCSRLWANRHTSRPRAVASTPCRSELLLCAALNCGSFRR